MEKMLGKIKWFKSNKGYGYIIGYDNEKYFFHISNSIENKEYIEKEEVRFIPMFDSRIPYAKEVEKYK